MSIIEIYHRGTDSSLPSLHPLQRQNHQHPSLSNSAKSVMNQEQICVPQPPCAPRPLCVYL
jgi:hypothetical protein